jgi:hypothetical protein
MPFKVAVLRFRRFPFALRVPRRSCFGFALQPPLQNDAFPGMQGWEHIRASGLGGAAADWRVFAPIPVFDMARAAQSHRKRQGLVAGQLKSIFQSSTAVNVGEGAWGVGSLIASVHDRLSVPPAGSGADSVTLR